jgi:hypothetical protein
LQQIQLLTFRGRYRFPPWGATGRDLHKVAALEEFTAEKVVQFFLIVADHAPVILI